MQGGILYTVKSETKRWFLDSHSGERMKISTNCHTQADLKSLKHNITSMADIENTFLYPSSTDPAASKGKNQGVHIGRITHTISAFDSYSERTLFFILFI